MKCCGSVVWVWFQRVAALILEMGEHIGAIGYYRGKIDAGRVLQVDVFELAPGVLGCGIGEIK